jgi:hypothetical protein
MKSCSQIGTLIAWAAIVAHQLAMPGNDLGFLRATAESLMQQERAAGHPEFVDASGTWAKDESGVF